MSSKDGKLVIEATKESKLVFGKYESVAERMAHDTYASGANIGSEV
ncbi:hypothetical protein [Mycoplasmopsis agalactiae]|nr:hypothetical protein [Mycoplasmopsis agalactiae]